MHKLNDLTILYVNNDPIIRDSNVEYLDFFCQNVLQAKDESEAYKKFIAEDIDIVILDIYQENFNAFDFIHKLKLKNNKVRIVLVSAHLKDEDFYKALDIGLLKYLNQPLDQEKLLPMLKICMLDTKNDKSIIDLANGYKFDLLNETLFSGEKQIYLTKKELAFLKLLIKYPERTVKYDEFEALVWNGLMSDDALRSVVKELRKKIYKEVVRNVSGVGYQINIA